jgi:hypothetical protein
MRADSGGNSLLPVGGAAKPPKFPTKLSNFRHTPSPFALEKIVFSPLLDQNFRKFVNFPEVNFPAAIFRRLPPAPPRFPPLQAEDGIL